MTALYNHQAERDILSGCFARLEDLNIALSDLTLDDFHDKKHQWIFKTIQTLSKDSTHLVTPHQVVREVKEESNRGVYIDDLLLISRDYCGLDMTSLCNKVKTCSKVRKTVDLAHLMVSQGMSLESGQEELYFQKFNKSMNEVMFEEKSDTTLQLSEFAKSNATYKRALDHQQKRLRGEEIYRGHKTGLTDLDEMIGGMEEGHLIVIGARPSIGKTTLMTSIANNLAKKDKKVAIFTIEMGAEEIAKKMICALTQVNYQDLENGRLTSDEINKLWATEKSLFTKHVFFDGDPVLKPYTLKMRLKRLKQAGLLDVVMIDYLQIMHADESRYESNQVKIASISRSLKQIAKELKVPIVALAQLNREAEARPPSMADLRESGSIEADADHIWLMHRPVKEVPKEGNIVISLLVAKNRFGRCGKVEVLFNLSHGEIVNYTKAVPTRDYEITGEKYDEKFDKFSP